MQALYLFLKARYLLFDLGKRGLGCFSRLHGVVIGFLRLIVGFLFLVDKALRLGAVKCRYDIAFFDLIAYFEVHLLDRYAVKDLEVIFRSGNNGSR